MLGAQEAIGCVLLVLVAVYLRLIVSITSGPQLQALPLDLIGQSC